MEDSLGLGRGSLRLEMEDLGSSCWAGSGHWRLGS